MLASYAAAGPTIFGGDVNRYDSCAPAGAWTSTDAAAEQLPGIQHVCGAGLVGQTLEIEGADYTDHDVMVVRARLSHR